MPRDSSEARQSRARRVAPWWLLAVVLPIGLSIAGCYSTRRPPKLSNEARALAHDTRLPWTVAVAAEEVELRSLLERTALFERVVVLGGGERPDLVASTADLERGAGAVFPLWSLLTLGIVPTTFPERYGIDIDFRGPSSGDAAVRVGYSTRGRSILGWAALPANLLPGRIQGDPIEHDLFAEHLALEILERREELAELVSGARE